MNKRTLDISFYKVIICIVLITFSISCSDVIDLNGRPAEPALIIYGRVTDGTAGNVVSIFLSSERSDGAQQHVSDARVFLIEDGQTVGEYKALRSRPGDYRLDMVNDSARQGRTYQLAVELPNGDRILSQPTTMPGLAAIDSVYIETSLADVVVSQEGFTVQRRLAQLFADTRIVEYDAPFYLKWNIIEAYTAVQTPQCCGDPPPPCYVTNDITGQEIRLLNGADLKSDVIERQSVISSTIDGRFAFAYYYVLVQSTVDEQAYEYWRQIREVANLSGSIFDKTTGNVDGNLYYENRTDARVFGYFEVARSDTSVVWMNSDDFDFFLREPCPAARIDQAPPECDNCLLIPNSTHDRPYFYQ